MMPTLSGIMQTDVRVYRQERAEHLNHVELWRHMFLRSSTGMPWGETTCE